MRPYEPHVIEPKWQKYWAEKNLFAAKEDPKKPKYYLLEMLPYPSGRIHMGHIRNYTIGDVAARYKMMQGFSVLHPMGWDAFGLPAENAAIERGIHPAVWTRQNIAAMKEQFRPMGYSYDWSREFATCDPEYYRWEQWVFIRLLEEGLVYRKASNVNWCVTCNTVLANEQVERGLCWRCSGEVIQKRLDQWYFKTTAYAEELLRDIDEKLQGWPERVRVMQKEWIGRSEGALINFSIEGASEKLTVFTTRPDTLFGVTFMSLACEHPQLRALAERGGRKKEVEAFIKKTAHLDRMKRLTGDYEKEGTFTGAYCRHPLTGEKIPVYAANFVLMDYGTGAVMAVPAHDTRDLEFAKKYGLPVRVVITEEGILTGSGRFDGTPNVQAMHEIVKEIEKQGVGRQHITYKLKDWCLSRQRYWGTPIPILHCPQCGIVPVPAGDLPVVLPEEVEFSGKGESPLAKNETFLKAACPLCGKPARRETDTMDTFVESSWYFFRYTSPHCKEAPFDRKAVAYWMPIDQYIGGIEHAVGHLMYCRFYTKVLRDLGLLELDEPVRNLMTQGMVVKEGAKMSKSRGNVVEPDAMIRKYGADAVRLFILFAAPPEKDLDWNEKGIEGMVRFLGRVWRLAQREDARETPDHLYQRHWTIKRVTRDVEAFHFNTALAALMEYANFLQEKGGGKEDLKMLVLLLSPFAPHAAEEMWERLGESPSCLQQPWPRYEEGQLRQKTVTVVVQVNGRLRGSLEAEPGAGEETVAPKAKALENVAPHLEGKTVVKTVYLPNRLINFVVK